MLLVLSDAPKTKEEQYTGEKIQLALPEPTGEYKVGTIEMHLVDDNRKDPWVKKAKRELMISLWYPAKAESNKKTVYMQPNAAKIYDEIEIPTIGVDTGLIDISGISTNAWEGASILIGEEPWPVILYSPGAGVPRNFGTTLVEELVSHGYVVITVDHTYIYRLEEGYCNT